MGECVSKRSKNDERSLVGASKVAFSPQVEEVLPEVEHSYNEYENNPRDHEKLSPSVKIEHCLMILQQFAEENKEIQIAPQMQELLNTLYETKQEVMILEQRKAGGLEDIRARYDFLMEAAQDDQLRPEERSVARYLTDHYLSTPLLPSSTYHAETIIFTSPVEQKPSMSFQMRASDAAPVSKAILEFEDNKELKEQLNIMHTWNFDVFMVWEVCENNCLAMMGKVIIEKMDFHQKLDIDLNICLQFLSVVGQNYHDKNPYHNCIHACDCMVTQFYYLTSKTFQHVKPLDSFASIIAAACHDINHPGKNQNFLVNTKDPLALLYNDQSVLEMHHASFGWNTLLQYNFLTKLSKEKQTRFRRVFIHCILATDMTKHSESAVILGESIGQQSGEQLNSEFTPTDEGKLQALLAVAVHAADISNPTKPSELYLKWSGRIMNEFYAQGDAERELGLPISDLCDKETSEAASVQLGFINFVVLPWFKTWNNMFPDIGEKFLMHLAENKAFWSQQLAKKIEPVEASATVSSQQDNIVIMEDPPDETDDSSMSRIPGGVKVGALAIPTNMGIQAPRRSILMDDFEMQKNFRNDDYSESDLSHSSSFPRSTTQPILMALNENAISPTHRINSHLLRQTSTPANMHQSRKSIFARRVEDGNFIYDGMSPSSGAQINRGQTYPRNNPNSLSPNRAQTVLTTSRSVPCTPQTSPPQPNSAPARIDPESNEHHSAGMLPDIQWSSFQVHVKNRTGSSEALLSNSPEGTPEPSDYNHRQTRKSKTLPVLGYE